MRILVIEDEPTIAAGLQDDLEFEGYEVVVGADGDEGAALARDTGFDLILLDIMLPGKDGFTLCRELRADGIKTPIILLTAKGQEVDMVLGLELGADDYVTKPFSPRELLARIRALLRRTNDASETSEIHEFGSLAVDLDRCEVHRDGKAIKLTAREFKILRTLIKAPGHVFSVDELIRTVWGPNACLTDRVVYTHINNLRRKLETESSKPTHFRTVRGMGYRFDP